MPSPYETIISLLNEHKVPYQEFDHDPILSYENAEREKAKFGWSGVESKNVFMKGNDDRYYVCVTVQGKRVDMKKLKELLGVKLSIASEDDVRDVIHCVPGCVAPFGFSPDIVVLLDMTIFAHTDYLFSPGVTTKTIHADLRDLKRVFDALPNTKIEVEM